MGGPPTDCIHFSCAYSPQPPNGERLGSVWIPKFRFLKTAAGCGYVLTARAHCFVLLGLSERPAGLQEQWRICLLPPAPACLDSVVSLATGTRAPSVPNKGPLAWWRREAGYCSDGNLAPQPDRRPGPSSRRRREPAEAGRRPT